MENKYEKYILHPDDNFNDKLIKKLNHQKIEILLNERCFYNCTKRVAHYKSIAQEQISQIYDTHILDNKFLNSCSALPEKKQSYCNQRNISLSLTEAQKLHGMGIRHFKLQGRVDNLYLYFYDLIRFLLDDQIAGPTVFAVMSDYIANFIEGGKYEFY
jgi:collagenase-like PrtC family protease